MFLVTLYSVALECSSNTGLTHIFGSTLLMRAMYQGNDLSLAIIARTVRSQLDPH